MRYICLLIVIIALFLCQKCYSQIYNTPKEFNYQVSNDILNIHKDIKLRCNGDLWEIPFQNEKEENNWSITWIYDKRKGNTGVIENDSVIFLHPPRMKEFAQLEFCPFPIVHLPISVSKTWTFKITGTKDYIRSINREVNKEIDVVSQYTVKGKVKFYSFWLARTINCWEIRGLGQTELGQTGLTAYFSDECGFVFLDFETINGYNFTLTLKSINPINNTLMDNNKLYDEPWY